MASELARAKATIANVRRRNEEVEAMLVRKSVIAIAAAATGFAESKGLQPGYFGVPTKLGIATGMSLLEALTRDKSTRRFLGAIADAELAAYTYAATKNRAFIAGVDVVGDGGIV